MEANTIYGKSVLERMGSGVPSIASRTTKVDKEKEKVKRDKKETKMDKKKKKGLMPDRMQVVFCDT